VDRLQHLEEENARLRARLADLIIDSERWTAVRKNPTLFYRLYERSPGLEKHFGKMVSRENVDHGKLSDVAADRLRMVRG
jgi:hypothetical protein